METKSSLAKVASIVGTASVILALFLLINIQHREHSSRKTSASPITAAAPSTQLSTAQKKDWSHGYGQLPLAFEVNQGQTAPDVRFIAHGEGYQLFLTSQDAVLTLRQPPPAGTKAAKGSPLLAGQRKRSAPLKTSALRIHLDGANPAAEIAGTKLLPGKVNYFIGNDPQKWRTDIPTYEAVRYQGIYPGVDLLFYGREQRLEYDFIVAPGADAGTIALSTIGARNLEINSRGDLLMNVGGGKVTLHKPSIYQEVHGERRQIAGNYVIANDHRIRFSVARYDHSEPLTIDPVLNYSTYIGGEVFDQSLGIALDAAGDAYIAGFTQSTKFPTMNPVSATTPGDVALGTAFVSELNPTGTALIYSTYLGGSGNGSFGDGANAIAVDTASPPNIYVTGFSGSPDFPVSTVLLPYQGQPGPGSTASAVGGSAFITKLAPSATGAAQLAYSSYLGGNTYDEGFGIAVDGSGNAYIAGATASSNFPQQGTAITSALTSPNTNAFLTKINTAASGAASLVYSTYLGGSGVGSNFLSFGDVAFAITVDSSSNAYLVGGTTSTDFPTAGTAISGSAACGANAVSSAFLSVISTTAQTLTYSHCLSGSNYDLALGVNLGTGVPPVATGIVYITGTTGSSNFPLSPVPGTIPPAGTVANGVAFVSLLNTANGTLQYSTYLGGTNSDTGYAISSDSSGNAYVTGQTSSTNFPITQGALVETLANQTGAAFVSKISPNGNGIADLVYSSYFGGLTPITPANPDNGRGIVVSGTNAYISGQMTSADMPVSSTAFQKSLGGTGATNAYVADLPLTPTISVSPTSINFGIQLVGAPTSAQFVTLTNNTSASVDLTLPPTTTGANAADFVGAAGGTTPCGSSLAPGAPGCTIGVVFTPSIAGAESATLNIVDALDGPSHPIQVALSGTGSTTIAAITFSPTSLTFPGQLLTTTSSAMPVVVKNTGTTPLTISKVATGTSAFTETDNCAGTTVAPTMTCTIMVTFAPQSSTAPGTVTDAVSVTDNASGSPQTVGLTGTAWDFSVTAGSASVAKGAMGTFPVTITGLGGFTGAVSFTCTPASSLVTTCAVPTTNAAAAPGAMVNGTLTAASFVVAPES
ncbi:MAG: SBBP repeat-containing protein, partial [Candidatus Acidiferrales bacterium]